MNFAERPSSPVAETDTQTKRPRRPASLAILIMVHLAALALAWAVASLVSKSHGELSPLGFQMRLVPVLSAP